MAKIASFSIPNSIYFGKILIGLLKKKDNLLWILDQQRGLAIYFADPKSKSIDPRMETRIEANWLDRLRFHGPWKISQGVVNGRVAFLTTKEAETSIKKSISNTEGTCIEINDDGSMAMWPDRADASNNVTVRVNFLTQDFTINSPAIYSTRCLYSMPTVVEIVNRLGRDPLTVEINGRCVVFSSETVKAKIGDLEDDQDYENTVVGEISPDQSQVFKALVKCTEQSPLVILTSPKFSIFRLNISCIGHIDLIMPHLSGEK